MEDTLVYQTETNHSSRATSLQLKGFQFQKEMEAFLGGGNVKKPQVKASVSKKNIEEELEKKLHFLGNCLHGLSKLG